VKYCSACGEKVALIVPEGDNRQRYVCQVCEAIHYQNPNVVTGCIAQWQDKILLCKRAIEPRYGLWTLPAGFMENGESNIEGAARETFEEANARLENMQLYCVFSVVHINQIYIMYIGDLVDGEASAGSESLEVALFDESEIPWSQIAFRVISENLRLYFEDKKKGKFKIHYADIIKQPDGGFEAKYY
jgi:ADP-ribose pyrophosphatase YjhB (NUDIX family)